MAIQPAKSSFSKSEIAEILRENVMLFKDEPAFPEYIVNLGLYLVDHAYVVNGERAQDLESVISVLSGLSRQGAPQLSEADRMSAIKQQIRQQAANQSGNQLASLLKQDNQSRSDSLFDEGLQSLDDSEAFDETDPHFLVPIKPILPPSGVSSPQPLGRLSKFKPVMSSTKDFADIPKDNSSPAADESFHEPKTDKLNEHQLEEIRRQTQADFEVQAESSKGKPSSSRGSRIEDEKTERLRYPSSVHEDEPVLSEEEKKKTLGRAQVYKVARDYRSKREDGDQCPSCGARTRGRAVCPSCGHIL